ncbi:hypothetical protein LguiB_003387 [Lonicera macranthoides]
MADRRKVALREEADPMPPDNLTRKMYIKMAKAAVKNNRFKYAVKLVEKLVGELSPLEDLDDEERELLGLTYKCVFLTLQNAWLQVENDAVIAEMVKDTRGSTKLRGKRLEIETEILEFCEDGVLKLLRNNLVPRASSFRSKVFYLRLEGDFCLNILKYKYGEEQEIIASDALDAYTNAQVIANDYLEPTDPTRLRLVLNFSVFYRDILHAPRASLDMAIQLHDLAMSKRADMEGETLLGHLRDFIKHLQTVENITNQARSRAVKDLPGGQTTQLRSGPNSVLGKEDTAADSLPGDPGNGVSVKRSKTGLPVQVNRSSPRENKGGKRQQSAKGKRGKTSSDQVVSTLSPERAAQDQQQDDHSDAFIGGVTNSAKGVTDQRAGQEILVVDAVTAADSLPCDPVSGVSVKRRKTALPVQVNPSSSPKNKGGKQQQATKGKTSFDQVDQTISPRIASQKPDNHYGAIPGGLTNSTQGATDQLDSRDILVVDAFKRMIDFLEKNRGEPDKKKDNGDETLH